MYFFRRAMKQSMPIARDGAGAEAAGNTGERFGVWRGFDGHEGDAIIFAETIQAGIEADFAFVEDDGAAADAFDIIHVVRRKENGGAFAIEELDGDFEKIPARGGIETGGGLVQQ